MKLSHDQIRIGILHPQQFVRDAAVRFFGDSFSDDPAAMPAAIEAIEAYGWDNAFESPVCMAGLAQTQDTLLWVIDELNRMGRPQTESAGMRCWQLSSIIAAADVTLLMKHDESIMGLEGLFSRQREAVAERLRLMTADTDSCWQELEELCRRGDIKDKADVEHANRLVEALGRDETSSERVFAILSDSSSQSQWMEGLAARLAGELRMEAAAATLAAALRKGGGDYVAQECTRAFIKIGTDQAVEDVCANFASAPRDFKLRVSSALANIHCDSVVPRCLELLAAEKAPDIKRSLISAMLGNFSAEGIEPARQMVLNCVRDLRGPLVAAATLMDIPLPELPQWTQAEQAQAAAGKHRQDAPSQSSPATPGPHSSSINNLIAPAPAPPIKGKQEVGRNDPCPCGSGKKYKKCHGK